MSDRKVRVLVVDDSAFARKVLREVIGAHAQMEVVGVARDGIDALEQIEALHPDVVSLDLVMPGLDGVGVLHALRSRTNPPAVVVVSMADEDSELGVAALQAGAFDVVHKPTALALDRLYQLSDELTEKILEAALARRGILPNVERSPLPKAAASPAAKRTTLVVVGASTGGPQAVTRLVGALPADFPVPVLVVLHMPAGYTEPFARRLDRDSAVDVMEARDSLELRGGQVVIARAGIHLLLHRGEPRWRAKLDLDPTDTPHRPAVDVLFRSAAENAGAGALGIVLTGMGSDGREGARAIRSAGGRVLTETESSCVVYGMPRCVFEAGLSDESASIGEMASLLMKHL
jgi:two-component system, chemotaxis family, protein-glutamate methylesterase/glutaminase